MERRRFLAASVAASTLALAGDLSAQVAPNSSASVARVLSNCAAYALQQGPQTKLAETYFADALIPALTRLGFGPVGRDAARHRAGDAG